MECGIEKTGPEWDFDNAFFLSMYIAAKRYGLELTTVKWIMQESRNSTYSLGDVTKLQQRMDMPYCLNVREMLMMSSYYLWEVHRHSF